MDPTVNHIKSDSHQARPRIETHENDLQHSHPRLLTSRSSEASRKANPELREKHETAKRWPKAPQPLRRRGVLSILSCVGDALTALTSCLFFVYGAFVIGLDGTVLTKVPNLSLLQDASRYGPTVFPILFAAIVGQAMHAIAHWRLENGERMKILDQLLGSTGIFSTVVTQFRYRNIGFVGASLILLWALSPVGGQASLRVLDYSTATTMQPLTVQYLDMTSDFEPGQTSADGDGDAQDAIDTAKSLYVAALLSPQPIKISSMDTWTNFKVPMLEHQSNLTQDGEGWFQVDQENTTYSSQIGLPTSGLALDTNTTFRLETSYWVLDCPELKRPKNGVAWNPGLNETTLQALDNWVAFFSQSWSFSSPYNHQNLSAHKTLTPRELFWVSYDDDGNMTYAQCTMNTSYVEISTNCLSQNCSVTHIRRSRASNPDPAFTIEDHDMQHYTESFFNAVSGNTYKPTAIQRYFVNPATPFNNTPNGLALYKLDPGDFATSLAQLMNTHRMAGLGLTYIPTALPSSGLLDSAGTMTLSAQGTASHSTPILKCRRVWLALLFVSTAAMFLAGVFGLVLEITRCAPDLALNISSLMRDNPYIKIPRGGSTLDAVERGRLLQDVRVRFGDVRGSEEVGYIAIRSYEEGKEGVEGAERLRGFDRGRLYA